MSNYINFFLIINCILIINIKQIKINNLKIKKKLFNKLNIFFNFMFEDKNKFKLL